MDGSRTHSALLADAGHVLTDAGRPGAVAVVVWFSRQPVTAEKTYGYLRWGSSRRSSTAPRCSVFPRDRHRGHRATARPGAGGWRADARRRGRGLVANAVAALMLHPVRRTASTSAGPTSMCWAICSPPCHHHRRAVIWLTVGCTPTHRFAAHDRASSWRGAWTLVRESRGVRLESTPSHIALGKCARGAGRHPRRRVRARSPRLDV